MYLSIKESDEERIITKQFYYNKISINAQYSPMTTRVRWKSTLTTLQD